MACSRAGAGNWNPEPGPNVTGAGVPAAAGGIPVVALNWLEVRTPFLVALWIAVAGVLKMGRCGRRL